MAMHCPPQRMAHDTLIAPYFKRGRQCFDASDLTRFQRSNIFCQFSLLPCQVLGFPGVFLGKMPRPPFAQKDGIQTTQAMAGCQGTTPLAARVLQPPRRSLQCGIRRLRAASPRGAHLLVLCCLISCGVTSAQHLLSLRRSGILFGCGVPEFARLAPHALVERQRHVRGAGE